MRFSRAVTALGALAWALAGCEKQLPGTVPEVPGRKPALHEPAAAAPASHWLVHNHSLTRAWHGEAPAGLAIDQATYFADGVLLLLRHAEPADSSPPGEKWLVYVYRGNSSSAVHVPVAMQDGAVPDRLLPGPGRKTAALLSWPLAAPPGPVQVGPVLPEASEVTNAAPEPVLELTEPQVELLQLAKGDVAQPDATARMQIDRVALGGALVPVHFGPEGMLYLRPLGGAKLNNAVVQARLDWTAPLTAWRPGSSQPAQPFEDPAYKVSPDQSKAAGLKPAASPTLDGQPLWEVYVWRKDRGVRSRPIASLPVAAERQPDDSLSLTWLDDNHLTVVAPSFAGQDRLDWRLYAVPTGNGQPALLTDHLPAETPALATGGAAFYCRPAGVGQTWELWAVTADGTKRMCHVVDECDVLRIADAQPGRLLLVREYSEAGTGLRRHALLEIGTGKLQAWALEPLELHAPGEAPGGLGAPARGGSFIPDELPQAEADKRYRRRDNPPGEPPPDLSLPGL